MSKVSGHPSRPFPIGTGPISKLIPLLYRHWAAVSANEGKVLKIQILGVGWQPLLPATAHCTHGDPTDWGAVKHANKELGPGVMCPMYVNNLQSVLSGSCFSLINSLALISFRYMLADDHSISPLLPLDRR